MTLRDTETATYEAMWGVADYANTSPGGQLVPAFLDMSGATPQAYPSNSLFQSLKAKGMAGRIAATQQTVLDAGSGSGKGAVELVKAGFRVEMCDLTAEGLIDEAQAIPFRAVCLWEDLRVQLATNRLGGRFDYVYCCDVLEHIPTPFTMLVISRLLEVTKRGLFLSIALQGDNFGVWVGKPLHQTVMNFVQWRDVLDALGRVKECRDMLLNGVYYVEPR